MTAYAAACSCGWQVGPIGNPSHKRGRLARWYVHLRERLHSRRCGS